MNSSDCLSESNGCVVGYVESYVVEGPCIKGWKFKEHMEHHASPDYVICNNGMVRENR
jgi:hypothetical protein